MFVLWAVLIFASAYAIQWLFIVEFGWGNAPKYAAFLQNLLMSGLFIAMFVARRGPRGQSVLLAVAKWIGTLAPTILFGAVAGSAFILGLGLMCSVFDLAYIGLLFWGATWISTRVAGSRCHRYVFHHRCRNEPLLSGSWIRFPPRARKRPSSEPTNDPAHNRGGRQT
jgi:hypothetical protein